jgi:hypothetical protein
VVAWGDLSAAAASPASGVGEAALGFESSFLPQPSKYIAAAKSTATLRRNVDILGKNKKTAQEHEKTESGHRPKEFHHCKMTSKNVEFFA